MQGYCSISALFWALEKARLRQPILISEREYTAEECVRENKKTEDGILEYLLAASKHLAHPLHPIYDNGKGGGVQWWVKRCPSSCVQTQVAWMGADVETLEEFWMKYGPPELLDCESLFQFFFWMKHTPPAESGAFMSRTEGCSEVAWRQSVARVREYLNHVVQEIRWADRLNPFNPHFPFFRTSAFHGLHAHQFHWRDMECRPAES